MSHEPDKPMGKADLPPPRTWRRQAIGWGAATAVFSAVLALVANLSEVAGWLRPDETREIVEETRKTIVGTNAKVDELVILLRNQAAAAGVDLNIASDAAIRNAISAIVASGDAQKQKAVKFINNGDVAGAAELLTKVATEQASAVSQTREAAAESWREAAALYNLQDLTKAVDSYEQANRLQPDDPDTLSKLGMALFHTGMPDRAEKLFLQCLALDPAPPQRSTAHYGIGQVAKQRGDYARSEEQLTLALQIAETNGVPVQQVYALIALSQLRRAQGKLDIATATMQAALTRAEQIQDEALQAKTLGGLGTLAATREDYTEAKSLMQRALAIHQARNDLASQASVIGNLGAVALLQEDTEQAESMLLKSVALSERLGWQSSVAYDLVNLGSIAAGREDFEAADDYLARAETIARAVGLSELVPIITFNRGEMAMARGDAAMACEIWSGVLPVLTEMGSAHAQTAETMMADAKCD